MNPHTTRLDLAVIGRCPVPAKTAVRVDICDQVGNVLATTDPRARTGPTLHLLGGTLSVDRTAQIRRRISNLALASDRGGLAVGPWANLTSLLSGNEIHLWRGFSYEDGTEELMRQGIFGFATRDVIDEPNDYSLRLNVYDRSRRFVRDGFPYPWTVDPANTVLLNATLIWANLGGSIPPLEVVGNSNFHAPQINYDEGSDRWAALVSLLDSIAYEPYFTTDGTLRFAPEPDLAVTGMPPAWTVAEGTDGALLSVARSEDNESVANWIICTGESSYNLAPAYAVATDSDLYSLTYVNGPYGRVTKTIRSNLVQTDAQAFAVAYNELRKSKNLVAKLAWRSLWHPALVEADFVHLQRARSGVDTTVIIDSFSADLLGGEMSCTGRPTTA